MADLDPRRRPDRRMVAVTTPVVSVVGKIGAVSGADIAADPAVTAAIDARIAATDHNDLAGIQGGTDAPDERYHLTAAQAASVASIGGLVPYTGATSDVDLDAQALRGANVNVNEGTLTDPTITDLGGLKISVTSVDCLIRSDAVYGSDGWLYRATVPAAVLDITDDAVNHLYVTWNAGSPIYTVSTSRSALNLSDNLPVARLLVRSGAVYCHLDFGYMGRSAAIRWLLREVRVTEPIGGVRESGLTLGEAPTRLVTVAAGTVWFVLNNNALPAFTQGVGGAVTYLLHHTGGVWTMTPIGQYDNTQYDNGTNLVTLTNNRYAVNWVYRSLCLNEVVIVLGGGDYSASDAIESTIPTTPSYISEFYLLVGRIIVQKGATSAYRIENAVSTTFETSPVVAHNDLDGLQGGVAGEYYHLTSAQHGALVSGYVPYTGATSTVDLGTQSLYAGNVAYNEGLLSDPTITDAAGSAIALTSVDCLIRDDATWGTTARLYRATVPAVASLAVTDNALNYIYVDWNAGSPIYAATTNRDLLNHSNRVPAARVYMESGSIEYQLTYGALARGAAVRNVDRIYRIRGVAGAEREQGLALSEAATRLVVVGSGFAWTGLRRISLDSVTMGGVGVTSHLWYHSAGVWTEATITQYDNTQYDNGTNLVTLTANRYAVNWVYRALVGPEIDIVLGGGDYTLAQAEASTQPPIPPAILGFYLLVGRIIVQKGASTATAIESVVNTTFNQQAVSIHNDLSSLQGGTAGEYYHLTSAQYSALGTATSITSGTPAGGGAAGTAGQILYDAGRLYVCVAANTWKYVDLTALP